MTWENGQHFVTLPLVSPWRDIWVMTAEIPYWQHVTTQIWILLPIGWSKFLLAAQPVRSTTQIWVVPSHQHRISVVVSQTLFSSETSGGIAKCQLFSQATNPTAHHSANRVWQNSSRSQVCSGIFFHPALHANWIARLQIINNYWTRLSKISWSARH